MKIAQSSPIIRVCGFIKQQFFPTLALIRGIPIGNDDGDQSAIHNVTSTYSPKTAPHPIIDSCIAAFISRDGHTMAKRSHSEVKIAQSSPISELECAALIIKQQFYLTLSLIRGIPIRNDDVYQSSIQNKASPYSPRTASHPNNDSDIAAIMVERSHSKVKIAQSSPISELECAALIIKQQLYPTISLIRGIPIESDDVYQSSKQNETSPYSPRTASCPKNDSGINAFISTDGHTMVERRYNHVEIAQSSPISELKCAALIIKQQLYPTISLIRGIPIESDDVYQSSRQNETSPFSPKTDSRPNNDSGLVAFIS